MGRIYVAKGSSVANEACGVGVAKQASSRKQNKPILVHGYSVSPRGADFAADVQVYFMDDYGGLSSNLIESGDFTADVTTATWSADFSSDASSVADGGGGAPTIAGAQTVASVTECLKVTGTAGGDAFCLDRASTTTASVVYKMAFDYYAQASAGIAFLGLGDNGDAWDLGFDHDSGQHLTVTEGAWQTSQVVYGTADGTTLEICGFTAKNGQVRDTLNSGKYVAFKNIVLSAVSNNSHWTRSADTDFHWDMYDGVLDADASGAATVTYNNKPILVEVGSIYKVAATMSSFVAGDVWLTVGGVTLLDLDANGTYNMWCVPSATTGLVVNADATGDGDVDSVAMYRENDSSGNALTLSDSIYNHVIRSGNTRSEQVTFPKPFLCPNGFYMYFTKAGASCIMDVNIFYEYI